MMVLNVLRSCISLHPVRINQSNGMAEKGVITAKNLMKKVVHDGRDPYLGISKHTDVRCTGIPSTKTGEQI